MDKRPWFLTTLYTRTMGWSSPWPGRNVPNPSTFRIEPAHCKATANGNSRDQNLVASSMGWSASPKNSAQLTETELEQLGNCLEFLVRPAPPGILLVGALGQGANGMLPVLPSYRLYQLQKVEVQTFAISTSKLPNPSFKQKLGQISNNSWTCSILDTLRPCTLFTVGLV